MQRLAADVCDSEDSPPQCAGAQHGVVLQQTQQEEAPDAILLNGACNTVLILKFSVSTWKVDALQVLTARTAEKSYCNQTSCSKKVWSSVCGKKGLLLRLLDLLAANFVFAQHAKRECSRISVCCDTSLLLLMKWMER